MGWFRKAFLYREDYNPALQGLRGLAVLWFFHWSFYAQFDPAKLSRITGGRPWLEGVLEFVRYAVAPGEVAAVVMGVLCGFLLRLTSTDSRPFGRRLSDKFRRVYPVYLVSLLPLMAYQPSDWSQAARVLVFLPSLPDVPAQTSFLLVIAATSLVIPLLAMTDFKTGTLKGWLIFLSKLVLIAATLRATDFGLGFYLSGLFGYHLFGRLPEKVTPCNVTPGIRAILAIIVACVLPLPLGIRSTLFLFAVASLPTHLSLAPSFTARLLSHPVLRYFGAVALPFFLIHTTWGFRLSRSILQGELHSVSSIAAHYAMSLAFSAVFAGFLHIFFERPCFLRNGPAAGRKPRSDTQGVSP